MGVSFKLASMSQVELEKRSNEIFGLADDLNDMLYRTAVVPGSDQLDHSYGGFDLWRRRLAIAAGVDLDSMEGFGGTTPWPEWDGESPSLVPLLNHSDCHGDLSPEACRSVASMMIFMKDADRLPEDEGLDFTNSFLHMLMDAAERGAWLHFS